MGGLLRKFLDTYTLYARIFPGIISALPLLVLWYFLSRDVELQQLMSFLLGLKFLGGASLSAVFLYFYSQLVRITSKHFENKYFIRDAGFATTYLMTYTDNTFSKTYKDKYREIIRKTFDLELMNETRERENISEARKRLDEATELIIKKVGDDRLVAKHNVWYGFFRNLIGGTIYSMAFCLINILLGAVALGDSILITSSSVLFLAYAGVFVFRKAILVQNAEAYAKQLVAEFISRG